MEAQWQPERRRQRGSEAATAGSAVTASAARDGGGRDEDNGGDSDGGVHSRQSTKRGSGRDDSGCDGDGSGNSDSDGNCDGDSEDKDGDAPTFRSDQSHHTNNSSPTAEVAPDNHHCPRCNHI